MITRHKPSDWQDLENSVAEILEKSGLHTEQKKTISTSRGQVEIDVFATQNIGARSLILLCECKNWSNNIPQGVVHSFRTVLDDSGANVGYLISAKGFQSGAYEAAKNSNVRLVNWEGFQDEFEEEYFKNYFKAKLMESVDHMMTYVEPLSVGTFLVSGKLPQENVVKFEKLVEEYEAFGFLCLINYPGMESITQKPRLLLPLSVTSPEASPRLPSSIREVPDYEGFLYEAKAIAEEAKSRFRALLKN